MEEIKKVLKSFGMRWVGVNETQKYKQFEKLMGILISGRRPGVQSDLETLKKEAMQQIFMDGAHHLMIANRKEFLKRCEASLHIQKMPPASFGEFRISMEEKEGNMIKKVTFSYQLRKILSNLFKRIDKEIFEVFEGEMNEAAKIKMMFASEEEKGKIVEKEILLFLVRVTREMETSKMMQDLYDELNQALENWIINYKSAEGVKK